MPTPDENPFSARRVRPGAMPYRSEMGADVEGLVDRLARQGWVGQIIGPHGSGKSALVAGMIEALGRRGHPTRLVVLHDGQRRLPADCYVDAAVNHPAVLFVDGYEQLGAWERFRLRRFCRRRGLGLVVTAHRDMGLPELFFTRPSAELAQRIVEGLLEGYAPLVSAGDVRRQYEAHHGDLREMLFGLYDLYEQRRRSTPQATES